MDGRNTILGLCTVLVFASACAQDNRADERAPADTSAAPVDANRERSFVRDMLNDGRAEVELGRLAQQRAKNASVREFADMMVRDHTKAGDELRQMTAQAPAEQTQTTVDFDADHRRLRERLSELSGDAFDREYIDAMVDEHQEVIREVSSKSEDSDDPQVKAWAAKTLPALQQHLDRAKQIQESLNR